MRAFLPYLLLATLIPGLAGAVEIRPSSYDFSPATGTGDWNYTDAERTKLTDGIFGTDNWANGTDWPHWVGWQGIAWNGTEYYARDITIDFVFEVPVTINSITLGTNQDARNNWNVVLPSGVLIKAGGKEITRETHFDIANSGGAGQTDYNVGQRHDLRFQFAPIDTTSISIILDNAWNFQNRDSDIFDIPWDNAYDSANSGMFWIFLDEVNFQYQPVPEPGTLFLLSSGLATALACRRRWMSKVALQ
jgi:hypothetical protein